MYSLPKRTLVFVGLPAISRICEFRGKLLSYRCVNAESSELDKVWNHYAHPDNKENKVGNKESLETNSIEESFVSELY